VYHSQKDVLGYEYDFGDSWEYRITIEKILPPDSGVAMRALCLDGARARPPEDCGGIRGYDNPFKIIKNPEHEESASMLEWLGAAYRRSRKECHEPRIIPLFERGIECL
jgi:hypothetical protein